MAHVGQPLLPPYTRLVEWGWWSWNLGDIFIWCAHAIKDTWLIGPTLYQWFVDMSNPCYKVAFLAWHLDYDIRVKWSWVIGLTEQYTFRDILDYFSYWYQMIRTDPIWFVKFMFASISYDFWSFVYSTKFWFIDQLKNVVGWIDYWLSDPIHWIIDNLTIASYWLRSFLDNPSFWILFWVTALFPFLQEIVNNALIWVVNIIHNYTGWFWYFIIDPFGFILEKISLIHWEFSWFLNDPFQWLQIKILALFNLSLFELWDFPMTMFKRFMQQIRIRRGEVENLIDNVVCDIMCWFM